MMTEEQLPLNIEGIEAYQERVYNSSPAWLKTLRNRSFNQLSFEQLPTTKDEEWKYTSLGDFTNKTLKFAKTFTLASKEQFNQYRDANDINIVLVNGVFSAELSSIDTLPKGLTLLPLSKAIALYGTEMQDTMSKVTTNDTKILAWLNSALFVDGVFIKVDKNTVVEKLIHIIHVTTDIDQDTILFPRAFITVGESAQVNILESHVGYTANQYISNSVTDIKVAANAVCCYCKAEYEGAKATHIAATRMWQDRASQVETFSFAHGASLVRNNLSIFLKGEGTNTVMNGFYAIDGQQHVDNHTLLDIQQPNCTSYQLYKGLLNDKSRVVFNGKIYVHSDAQKTNGYQLNKHLLLGSEARIDTKPQLEIFADDVKCTHGATIGQLNQDEVFYLQSRCIPKATAIALLSKGFIDDIISTVKVESIRQKLQKLLANKFPDVKI